MNFRVRKRGRVSQYNCYLKNNFPLLVSLNLTQSVVCSTAASQLKDLQYNLDIFY